MSARDLSDLPWPRRTQRLLLRPPLAEDAAAVFAYRSLPETAQWLSGRPTDQAAHARVFAQRSGGTLVVEAFGEIVGDLLLAVEDAWSQAEVEEQAARSQAMLGWVFAPKHQGKGYATEAVRELITIAFELGVRRVYADAFADNPASARVMTKVGMRQEARHVKESLHRDGTWRDSVSFALLAEEA
ncbi:GNAT family N-acetyltransferase [Serinicoccus kebangsaanensis]|uniref:GNAT family N-acetyltransferase n=1 Tax=Serinicoccus kebangsaanensis TaxID=2602069 RepID=UPI001EE2391E|nr:GNAT family protein [Serinicoccus kebangsaanensis]